MNRFLDVWSDDAGAVVSVELMLIVFILMMAISASASSMKSSAQKNVHEFSETLQMASAGQGEIRRILEIEHQKPSVWPGLSGEARSKCVSHASSGLDVGSSLNQKLFLPPCP